MLARAPKSPHRILHCLRAPVGGLFRHVRDLVEEQTARGHIVGVMCDSESNDALTEGRLAELARHAQLGLHRVRMSRQIGLADLGATRRAGALVVSLDIGVVHGHGAKGGAYARLAALRLKRKGRPVAAIYTPHGGSLHYHPSSPQGRVYGALERGLARVTDAIVFESAYSERMFTARIGARVPLSRVVHNGLRPAEFAPHHPRDDAAELLFVGELRRLKGVDLLLEAMRELRTARPVRAVIVGAGPDATELQAQANALGLTEAVRFMGAMALIDALPLGRMMVVPSRAESFPYVVLEAAAAGLPLIAADVGGIGEIVAGTDTALVVPNSAPALAAAIRAALADEAAAHARAGRLKQRVAERFSVARMTDGVLDLYAEAAASLTTR